DKWSDAVLKMAPTVGRGPEELADALFFVASAGIRGAEALEVLEMSAKASAAGLGETKVVADLVTSAMNAYGSEVLGAEEATNILVAAVREGKAEADQIAGAMGAVIPLASEMGVTFDQLGAAFAGMTRTGTDARVAATQIKAILSSLKKPTDDAKDALREMDLSAGGLRKQIREDGLISALETLRVTTDQYGEEMVSRVFPNIRALVGILDLMGANMEDNIAIAERMVDTTGALDAAMDAASQTSEFKWNEALVTLEVTMVELGDVMKTVILPILETFGKVVGNIGDRLGAMSEEQRVITGKTVALTAAMGPLISLMGRLIKLVKGNPYALMAVALTAVVGLIVRKIRAMREEQSLMEGVETATARATTEYERQRSRIQFLVREIEDENLSNEARIRAIKELKSIMPGYNGTLTEEGKLINHNTESLEDYLKVLKQELLLKAFQESITETVQALIDVQKELDKANTKARETGRAWREAGKPLETFVLGKPAESPLLTAYSNAQTEVEKLLERQKGLNDSLDELRREAEEGDFFDIGGTGNEGGGGGTGGGGTGGGAETNLGLSEIAEVEKWADDFETLYAGVLKSREFADDAYHRWFRKTLSDSEEAELSSLKRRNKAHKESLDQQLQWEQMTFQQKSEMLTTYIGYAAQLTTSLADLFESQKQRELSAAANSDAKRKQIEEEYFKRQKAMAIAQALINGALAVTNLIANTPGSTLNPATWVGIGLAAAMTAVQVGVIAAKDFAQGGLVYGETIARMGEYPGARSNPEVVAPLDKLQSYIQPSMAVPREVELRVKGGGRSLFAVLHYEQMMQNTY
ncbi:phage tail tape measure protein, partial [Candidatus Uhrbacteria bacterium]|nr:phage tail tape measure protein [Candidatus Uhrbacteria bacterium]